MAEKGGKTRKELLLEVKDLRVRLEEAGETLSAIRSGAVDAIVCASPQGDRIYTLQGAEHPYRVFFEAMHEGAVTMTFEGFILFCNPQFAKLVKVPPEKAAGISFLDFVAEDARQSVSTFIAEAGLESHVIESSLKVNGDPVVPVSISVNLIRTEDMEAVCAVVTDLREIRVMEMLRETNKELAAANEELRISRDKLKTSEDSLRESRLAVLNVLEDAIEARQQVEEKSEELRLEISERKRAEEALRESERLYRAIGETINYGIWVCAPDGRNIYASESFLRLVGLTQQQCSDFGWGDVLHPDDAERTIAAWKECVLTGGTWDIEHRFRGVDGQWHPILARGVPVRDEKGQIICWAGINLDISRLKEAEKALQESEERLRFALETSHTGAWDLDLVDYTAHRSLEHDRIFGYEQLLPEWTYEMFLDHVLPEDRAAVDAKFREATTAHSDWSFECRIRRIDGEVRWIWAAGRHREDIAGARRMTGIVQDITERKRAEEALLCAKEELEVRVTERTAELIAANEALETEIIERRKALGALSVQTKLLDSFFRETLIPFVILDRDFNFVRVNDAYALACQRGVAEFVGHNHFEFYPHEENEAIFREVVRTKTTFQAFARPFAFPDHPEWGTTYWDWSLTPLLDHNGEVEFVIFALRDVTERVKAEQALRKKTDDLNERVKELNCLYVVSSLLSEQEIGVEQVLQEVVETLPSGWQHRDIVCARIVFDDREFRTDNCQETPWKLSRTIYQEGKAVGNLEVGYLSEKPPCDEGPFLKEEGALISTIAELLGEFLGRRQNAEMLQRSEARFRKLSQEFNTLLDAIPDSIILLNGDLRILWGNDSAAVATRKQLSQIVWQHCYTAIRGRSRPCEECPAVKCLATGVLENGQFRTRDRRIWEMQAFPLIDEDGTVEKVLTVAREITEKLKFQEEAIRSAKLASLGELAAGVAHEINNPINSIINYAQILVNKGDRQQKEYGFAGEIVKEGERIANIVKSLLSFSRDSREPMSPVSVESLIGSSLILTNPQMRRDGIALTMNISPDLPEIIGNAQQLQQVFLNVISNARYALNKKYPGSHKDKSFSILCEETTIDGLTFVRIVFEDHGTGIPPSLIDRVTDPFFTTKPGTEGTGLGLSICSTIVREHGGRLTITSIEGEYTRVVIDFPVWPEAMIGVQP